MAAAVSKSRTTNRLTKRAQVHRQNEGRAGGPIESNGEIEGGGDSPANDKRGRTERTGEAKNPGESVDRWVFTTHACTSPVADIASNTK